VVRLVLTIAMFWKSQHDHVSARRAPAVRTSLLAAALLCGSAGLASAQVTARVENNQLVVTGDANANSITLRLAAGDSTRVQVIVEGQPVVNGSPFLRDGFDSILVEAGDGADTIEVDEDNGQFTDTESTILDGGSGNDMLIGGSHRETLKGGFGEDTLSGRGGNDLLSGDAGNDVVDGGPGHDQIGWQVGAGSDTLDGGQGHDQFFVVGDNDVAERITVAPDGPRVRLTRDVNDVNIENMELSNLELINILAQGGNDILSGSPGLAPLSLQLDGGDGNDVLTGGDGNDLLFGGLGNDTLNGGAGNDDLRGYEGVDVQHGGPGDDYFSWLAVDSSETVDGGEGADTLRFSASKTPAANTVDTVTVERVGDRVVLKRAEDDIQIDMLNTETVEVDGDGGNDTLSGAAGLAPVSLRLIGGPGDDVLTGGDGDDTAFWFPGDGNDSVDGGPGQDRLEFVSSDADETMNITPNGERVRLFRQQGAITMDIGTTELVRVDGRGGNDLITVNPDLGARAILRIDGGNGNDILNTNATATVIFAGGNGVDTANFDGRNQTVERLGNAILVAGIARLEHSAVEQVNVVNAVAAPTLTITSPTTDPVTTVTVPVIDLSGTATDDALGSVTIGWTNDRGGAGAATGTANWTAAGIVLQPGTNVITVRLQDRDGNVATDVITVNLDGVSYTLAEGSTGTFFDTDILIANPHAQAAPVEIAYLRNDGTVIRQSVELRATSRTTIRVDTLAGLEATEFSATVTSVNRLPLVVERTMRWDPTGYGAHTEKATDGPSRTWLFAEGAQGFFHTFLLLANPGDTPNVATVEFLREGAGPIVRTFELAPTSRRTIPVGDIPEMRETAFGMNVRFQHPGVAERAMYFGANVAAGHESAGVNAASTSWFLAEGATGSFFTTFILLANPGDVEATATVTYLPETGQPVTRTKTLRPKQRLSVNVQFEDDALNNAVVATRVESTQPLLVERAQYWPGSSDNWYEAHNSFGATAVGTKWGLAEGRVGGDDAFQTFILLANANTTGAADVRITFLRENGTTIVKTFRVNPTSRLTVPVQADVPELQNEAFSAIVEVTSGPGIFVERAMYSNANGETFAAGTNALATRLP
jgi:Ca2+-binding RTX toxin-like protein